MLSPERQEQIERVEAVYQNLLKALRGALPESEIKEADFYFDHAEYGVGLDSLVFFIEKNEIKITDEAFEYIKQLALMMQMKDEWYDRYLRS